MIHGTVGTFGAIRTLVLVGSFAIGLVTIAVVPALAQTSGTWATTGSLNTARGAHRATLLPNGQVLVTGGEDAASNVLKSAELYNPLTGKWAFTGSMATPRVIHTATLLTNGEVLVAGGIVGFKCSIAAGCHAIYTATAELYNTFTGQWRTTGSMTTPRASQGATLLQNGQVLAAGGNNSDGSSNTSAELYDPSKGTWRATGSMNGNHASPATLLQDGRALVADTTGEIYHPSTGQWTLTAKMYYGQHFGAATTLLTNGDVLIYGNHFACYASELYDPVANTWARTQRQCGTGVSFGPLALRGTGKVLLAGGSIIYGGKSFPTTNCGLYDPSTNTWSLTGSLKQAAGHTLTLLSNGQALAVGRSDAELYTP